jgi:predicted ATP-dependent serine protease
MDYICPECGYTDEARGRCPSCDVPLIHIDDVGEEGKSEEVEEEEPKV